MQTLMHMEWSEYWLAPNLWNAWRILAPCIVFSETSYLYFFMTLAQTLSGLNIFQVKLIFGLHTAPAWSGWMVKTYISNPDMLILFPSTEKCTECWNDIKLQLFWAFWWISKVKSQSASPRLGKYIILKQLGLS